MAVTAEEWTSPNVMGNAVRGALLCRFHFFDDIQAGELNLSLLPRVMLAHASLNKCDVELYRGSAHPILRFAGDCRNSACLFALKNPYF